ncbi:MAG: iron ABC transporter permease [Propionibacteriaceae bacterium]|jgi:iron(III) transport system permease protein|nr:iron ABC transporter permease [Propionibacteriaceae bacterium]
MTSVALAPAPAAGHARLGRLKTYLAKPQNAVLLVLGLLLTVTTIAPLATIVLDTVTVHPGSVDDPTGLGTGYTAFNWTDLFTGLLAKVNFLTPLKNTVVMSVLACAGAIAYGGAFAYLVTRTNLRFKKWLSSIFIFPYIMPQWTLAVVWTNLFNSRDVTGGSDGLLAAVFGAHLPRWWCEGLIPSSIVLALHYAPFAYILIGAIFRNMDANLEEAATILNTPKWKTFFRITLPMITPAILSTILLVFSSAMGSYPVPHYLKFTTLATRYVQMNVNRQGEASILAVTMMLFGIALMVANQLSTTGRKSYTTVTGKSGQSGTVNLGRIGKWIVTAVFLVTTLFTAIYPILAFALETFLPNPGDYSFLTTGDIHHLTAKWWLTDNNLDGAMYGQYGILHNSIIWTALRGTLVVALLTALAAGTIGTLVGYCVSKNRRSRWANYVNNMAFLPYLMPSLAVGVAFFIFGSNLGLFNTSLLLIVAGTIKYIPFASRAALNSMLQLSGEIEESAIIQDIPWWKRMVRIIIPIQKSAIISGYMLPFMSCLRELTLFMLLCSQLKIVTTLLGYFDEMGLYAFSSAINLLLIVTILIFNALVNKLTGASLDKGIGG